MAGVGESSTNGQQLSGKAVEAVSPIADDPFSVSAKTFEEQFDESILQTLDIDTWRLGNDLDQEYRRIEREVREAEKLETAKERQIRDEFFPRLAALPHMPKNAGKHKTDPENIAAVHRGLLFNGGVEACDGTIQIHETLPLTIYQIGISLVSYRGDQGTWGQRLFRRDLRQKGVDVDEWLQFLERAGEARFFCPDARPRSARRAGAEGVPGLR
jgi:hypothetical protein